MAVSSAACLIYDKCRSANICALGREPALLLQLPCARPTVLQRFRGLHREPSRTEFHPGHNLHRRVLPRKIAVARMPRSKIRTVPWTTFSDEPDLTSIHGLYQHQRDGAAPSQRVCYFNFACGNAIRLMVVAAAVVSSISTAMTECRYLLCQGIST